MTWSYGATKCANGSFNKYVKSKNDNNKDDNKKYIINKKGFQNLWLRIFSLQKDESIPRSKLAWNNLLES